MARPQTPRMPTAGLPHSRPLRRTAIAVTRRSDIGIARQPIIGMNSKMNLTSTETGAYLDALRPLVAHVADRKLFVVQPFTSLWVARDRLVDSTIAWGAQDIHADAGGAHTGDVSGRMLEDLGCTYVAVGHHDRRRDHGETDELVAAKVAAAQRSGLTTIVCVGEVRREPYDVTSCWTASSKGSGRRIRPVSSSPTSLLGRLAGTQGPRLRLGWSAPISRSGRGWRLSGRATRRSRFSTTAEASDQTRPPGLLLTPGVDGLLVGRGALDPRDFAAIVQTQVDRVHGPWRGG